MSGGPVICVSYRPFSPIRHLYSEGSGEAEALAAGRNAGRMPYGENEEALLNRMTWVNDVMRGAEGREDAVETVGFGGVINQTKG